MIRIDPYVIHMEYQSSLIKVLYIKIPQKIIAVLSRKVKLYQKQTLHIYMLYFTYTLFLNYFFYFILLYLHKTEIFFYGYFVTFVFYIPL